MVGRFFSVSLQVIRVVLDNTGTVEAALAYIVLARHSKGGCLITTAGEGAIRNCFGGSRHKADKLIKVLRKTQWGSGDQDVALLDTGVWNHLTGNSLPLYGNNIRTKVLPVPEGPRVWLPNDLVDGVGAGKNNPPLRKIMDHLPKPDRADTLWLLLKLYENHSLLDYGGIDPAILRNPWECYKEGQFVEDIPVGLLETKGGLFFCSAIPPETPAKNPHTNNLFISEVTKGDSERFWAALANLRKLNLIYEVAMVYDGDVTHPESNPLYPLYVFDRYRRNKAKEKGGLPSGLASDMLSAAVGVLGDIHRNVFCVGKRLFVYVSETENAEVCNIMRLQYLPRTEDMVAGEQQEEHQINLWRKRLAEVDSW